MATEKSHEFRKKLIFFAVKIISLTKKLSKTPENTIYHISNYKVSNFNWCKLYRINVCIDPSRFYSLFKYLQKGNW